MTEIIHEWGVRYPDGHIEGDNGHPFLTPQGAAQWRRQHPEPGAEVVDRLHLIGDWEPDPDHN